MPANKNALIRYKTIDNCLRNKYRRWTIDNLVDACCDALYDMEGITKGVSLRTVQADLQIMRSDKLGYNAPIEVYDGKYYRYADPNYSIFDMPLSENDYEIMKEAVEMLKQLEDFDHFSEMADVVGRLQDKLSISKSNRKPIIHFDSMPNLKGLELLNPLYNYIANKQTLRIMYQSFNAKEANEYILYPYLLKEYRNRWFLFGSVKKDLVLYNLALDRMVSIEPIEEPFRENPKFDSEKFFDDVIGVSKNIDNKPRTIKFWASVEQSKYIKTKPLHHSQELIRQNEDGSCIFKISVVINFELYSVLMSYGPGVRVIYPRNAVNFMREKTKEMADMYEQHGQFDEDNIKKKEMMEQNNNQAEQYASQERISKHLREIEAQHHIKILYAVESGSRAWGYSSPDSDWDVRFIYVHEPEWYFHIEEQKDTIEQMFPDETDMAGWDLKKALRLFKSSNPSLFEWLHSPIIYQMDETFINEIRQMENQYFNKEKAMFHYNHIYKKHNDRYIKDYGLPLKRFLYYLRGILVCKWLSDKGTIPPVRFTELVDATVEEPDMKAKIAHLLELKKKSNEHNLEPVDEELFTWAEKWAMFYDQKVEHIHPEKKTMPDEKLNSLMYDTVKRMVTQYPNSPSQHPPKISK